MSNHIAGPSSDEREFSQSPWIIAGIVLIALILVILGITLITDTSLVSTVGPITSFVTSTVPGSIH